MIDHGKRWLLSAFGAAVACGCCGKAGAQGYGMAGCSLSADAASDFGGYRLSNTTGIPQLDQLFNEELDLLSRAMQVAPGFAFFDDSSGPNAFATPATLVQGKTPGSVIFGINLLAAEGRETWWGAAVAGIMAHEFSHMVQFTAGLQAATVQKELQADCMAGWYMGCKQVWLGARVVIDGFGRSLFSKGGYDFNNPNFHGTPQQRVQAMAYGYNAALNGMADLQSAFVMSGRAVGLNV